MSARPFVNLPGEEWRDVVGCPAYEVSNLGRVRSWWSSHGHVRSVPRLRTPVPATKRGGYPTVLLSVAGARRLRYVHHLVLEAFVGPRPSAQECRHKDGNVTNNTVDNLAWATHAENLADKVAHGTSQHGERNAQAKLTNAEAATIRNSKEPLKVLAARFGVRESTISRIRSGVRRAS